MKKSNYNLWEPGEYHYSAAYGFVPNIYSYLHEEDTAIRPCMLIVPGGGYFLVSPTEAELVAIKFYHKGFNVFVCTYTTNTLMTEPLKTQPMQDLSRAIRFIRKNATEFHIDPQKITLCGFSAGGHLCASVCVHYEDIADANPAYSAISNRPDAAILSYSVITSGEKAHKDSFVYLLGANPTLDEMEYMSLEKHVKSSTPPCFIWHTATDDLVPVENSLFFAQACRNNGVTFALHIFSHGPHGLSLANQDWADGKFGEYYAYAQIVKVVESIRNFSVSVSPEVTDYLTGILSDVPKSQPNEEVAVWPDLAHQWLENIWSKIK